MNRRHFLATAGLAATTLALRRPLPGQTPPASPSAPASGMDSILARIRPPAFPNRDFRIATTNTADARPAFLDAIHQCAASGGGRIIVPRGTWHIAGPLHLKSNTCLHLEDGAHLRFKTDDPSLYLPVVLTRWEGTELFNYSPLIYAYQAHNIAITGAGTIDGNAHDTFVKWRPRQKDDQDALRQMGIDAVPVSSRVFGPGHYLRPPLVQFFGCTNILLDGPRFIDSPFWVSHAIASSNITIRRIHVDSPHINNDGFDPESCADVLIEDCVFKTGDDCIAIKSGRDQDAWRIGRPTENVVIRRCEMHAPASGSGLAIGSEMSGGVRDIFVENLRMGTMKGALTIKANLDRGGAVERVDVRDVTVEKAGTLVEVTTGYHGYRGGNHPPVFRDFRFENIRCGEAGVPISLAGVPASPLENVILRDIQVRQAAKPAKVSHTKNLRADNITINGTHFQPESNVD